MKTEIKILFSLFLTSGILYAQDTEWEKNQGNVESLIYDVVGNKEIKLNPANRFFDPVPPQPVSRVEHDLSYDFENIFYGATPVDIKLRPRQLAAEPETKLYGNYVKAGFGNYISPFLDARFSNKREKEFSYGANVLYNHSFRGAVDKENSGEGLWGTKIYANAYGDKVTLFSDLGFTRQTLHFYGYPDAELVDKEDIIQHFNRLNFSLGARNSNNKDDFQYSTKLGLVNQSDYFGAKETRFYTGVNTSLEVIKDIWIEVDGQYHYLARKDLTIDNSRNYLSVTGKARFKREKIDFYAGLRVDINPDTLAGSKGLHIYPQGGLNYKLMDNLEVYAELTGGILLQSWLEMTLENPYVNRDLLIANTNKKVALAGGFIGNLAQKLSFDVGFEMSEFHNAAFFVNDPSDLSRFDVVYDTGKVVLVNPHLTLKFNENEKYRIGVRGDYFNYQTDVLDAAYHKPEYGVGLFAGLNFGDKVMFNTSLNMMGGIKYLESNVVNELNGLVNLDFEAEYFINSRFSAFLEFNNMISKNYQVLYRYPVKGFQVLGGVTYRF